MEKRISNVTSNEVYSMISNNLSNINEIEFYRKMRIAYKMLEASLRNDTECIISIKEEDIMEGLIFLITFNKMKQYNSYFVSDKHFKEFVVNISFDYNFIVDACSEIYDASFFYQVTIMELRKKREFNFEKILDNLHNF